MNMKTMDMLLFYEYGTI
ncbi:unnamed protein product [Acanthoscelides obtectus]|uniref:Uncharacterized protein n=1 Tax=Acanthoscelides obtectus TaxID=200917 RepID=A0A9P0L0H9_ACAOB|nr:unnamed protein product [Acanthoscelides obtectus]CAK1662968.1 hypothetical protein AOBTE_LOCUS23405 [Acanthoscelides obtectus]